MSYLLDTNIISELRKGSRCNANVTSWFAPVADSDLYLSVLVLGEVRRGIELARDKQPDKADTLQRWLDDVRAGFADRVLPVDAAVADEWGRMSKRRSLPVIDGLLAATAKIHRLTFVTRNDTDVGGLGVSVLNPFKPRRA